jgi:hypothetical protein
VGSEFFLRNSVNSTGARYGQYRAGKNQGMAGTFPPILQIQTKPDVTQIAFSAPREDRRYVPG